MINIKVLPFILCIVLLFGCGNEYNISECALLLGKIILIDPGHGGNDNGATYNGILEDEINLSVALLLQESLLEEGVVALITRTSDYDLSDMYSNNKKMRDLKERVKMINQYKVDLFISLHMNVYRDSSVEGAQVFFQKDSDNSRRLAGMIQNELNKIQDKDRKEMLGDYYVLNNSERVGVLVEMGFLTSPKDVEKIMDKKHQILITNTIINSIK